MFLFCKRLSACPWGVWSSKAKNGVTCSETRSSSRPSVFEDFLSFPVKMRIFLSRKSSTWGKQKRCSLHFAVSKLYFLSSGNAEPVPVLGWCFYKCARRQVWTSPHPALSGGLLKGLCCSVHAFRRVNSMNERILQETTVWLMQDLQSRCIMYTWQYFPAFLPLCPLISFPCAVVERDQGRQHQEEWWMRSDARQGRVILRGKKKKRHWLSNLPPAAMRLPHQNVRACQVGGSRWILIEWGELGTTHPDACLEKP